MKNLTTAPSSCRRVFRYWTRTMQKHCRPAFWSRSISHTPKRSELCWTVNLRYREGGWCATHLDIRELQKAWRSKAADKSVGPTLHQELFGGASNRVLHYL